MLIYTKLVMLPSKGCWFEPYQRHFILFLVLVQPRKCPSMTEKLLTGMKSINSNYSHFSRMLSYIFVCFVFRLKTVFQRCQKSKYSYIAVIVEIISFRLRSYRHFFKMQNISRSTFLTSRYFPSHWTLRCRSTPSSQRRLLYSRYYISPNKQHNKS